MSIPTDPIRSEELRIQSDARPDLPAKARKGPETIREVRERTDANEK